MEATFERLAHIYHVNLEPSYSTLRKLQKGEIDLGEKTNAVKKMMDPDLLEYNDNWFKIQDMVYDACGTTFRNKMKDSKGNGWVYNWFCCDFVNFENNPRRRCMGYHNIFDYYKRLVENLFPQDTIHFHFHPHPIINDAHISATYWFRDNSLEQILCRRIIDRNWFPVCNRPGFQVNRPDSHWFLEQYIPFDYSNMAMAENDDDKKQYDFSGGRSGDWRRAPQNWHPYHPSHDDYQIPGNCRRWITRCLNIGTRSYLIDEKEIKKAFQTQKNQILSFTNHDFRDIRKDVKHFRKMLKEAIKEYPRVDFEFTDPLTAMRKTLHLKPYSNKTKFSIDFEEHTYSVTVNIRTNNPVFGPQPYFAIKTKTGQYYHDNLDFQIPFQSWSYTFDRETLPYDSIEKIGVGANTPYGRTLVAVYDTKTQKTTETFLNE